MSNIKSLITREKKINLTKINGDFYHYGDPTWEPKKYPDLMDFISKLIKPTNILMKKILETHTPVHVINISKDINRQFKLLGLEESILTMFKYECPFNGFSHSAIIPTYYYCKNSELENRLFSTISDGTTLVPRYLKDIINDTEWYLSNYYRNYQQRDPLQNILMGEGYTDGCYPNDGSSREYPFLAEFENGDYIMFVMLLWCNK